jgi:TetR/AcrR family transcriptional repressor of lmrAB and yxaGH operons
MHRSDVRTRILAATLDLLRKSGLTGAALNAILSASGAPKGSLYHYFPGGKHDIVASAITQYRDDVAAVFATALARGRTPSDSIRRLFAALAQRIEASHFHRSCAVGTTTLDLDDQVDVLRPTLAATLDRWIDVIAARLPNASSAQTRSFAGLVLTCVQGAYVRCRASASSAPLLEAGEWLAPLADELADREIQKSSPRGRARR